MSTATILGAFPNENMRSVPDDAMFDISTYRYLSRGTRFGSSLPQLIIRDDRGPTLCGTRLADHGKAFESQSKLSKDVIKSP